jgi:hypothetical protein
MSCLDRAFRKRGAPVRWGTSGQHEPEEAEVSKTLYYVDRAFTPGLSPKHAAQAMVGALVEDAYGNATFSPEEAKHLASECCTLVGKAEGVALIWLRTVAGFAVAADEQEKHLSAHAD